MTPAGLKTVPSFTHSATLLRELGRYDRMFSVFLARKGLISWLFQVPENASTIAPFAGLVDGSTIVAHIADADGERFPCDLCIGQKGDRYLEILLAPKDPDLLDLSPSFDPQPRKKGEVARKRADDRKWLLQVRSLHLSTGSGGIKIVNPCSWNTSRPLRRRSDHSQVA